MDSNNNNTMSILLFTIISLMICFTNSKHFELEGSGTKDACILMDAMFKISVNAIQKDEIKASIKYDSEKDEARINGLCTDTKAHLILGFDGKVSFSFAFTNADNKNNSNGIVELDRFVQFVPNGIFPPYLTDIDSPIRLEDPETEKLSPADKAYECPERRTVIYKETKSVPGNVSFEVVFEMAYFKVQAFNVANSTYSPSVFCGSKTTTPSSGNTTTITTPAPKFVNNYYVMGNDNQVCIALEGRIDFTVYYDTVGTLDKTAKFTIPNDISYFGSCNLSPTTQHLVITFFDPSWTLEYIFKQKPMKKSMNMMNKYGPTLLAPSQSQNDLDYDIHGIKLTYTINEKQFPGIEKDKIGRKIEIDVTNDNDDDNDNGFPHKAVNTGYYNCNDKVEFNLKNQTTLITSQFRFKAFNNDSSKSFDGTPSECQRDKTEKSLLEAAQIVGIITAVCAGLVILFFLISCVMKKRNNRNQYQQVP